MLAPTAGRLAPLQGGNLDNTLTPDYDRLVLDSSTVQDAGVLLGLMGFLDAAMSGW